jgi:type IV secretion system protein VirB2
MRPITSLEELRGAMMGRSSKDAPRTVVQSLLRGALWAPALAAAQASSPFLTGATALETNIIAWLTPIAIILVMVLGAMAMANRISWGWCIAAILGIAIAFGAPQIVTWIRSLFGV